MRDYWKLHLTIQIYCKKCKVYFLQKFSESMFIERTIIVSLYPFKSSFFQNLKFNVNNDCKYEFPQITNYMVGLLET